MQLENDKGECLLQFGRVDDKAFHLDYKVTSFYRESSVFLLSKNAHLLELLAQAPFTAYTAFGAAICQFDL